MPLPRRSVAGKSATTRKKKKPAAATTSRAKRGEFLLFTAGPAVPDYLIKSTADDLFGFVLDRPGGRTVQIVDTRIDGRKIYGKYRELREVAPYMFA